MRVDQCVKQIDVSKVINKENMLLRHTSAQNFEVSQLVVVVLEKFFIVGPFRSPPQHRFSKSLLTDQMTKDITCEKCNYKTSKSVYLNNHIRTMHLMAEEVYRGMEKGCMKVSITRYQFKRHQELHKNVSCELCNKLFTAARSLKRHKNKQHLLIAESQDDTDNPLVAAHDIAFIIA